MPPPLSPKIVIASHAGGVTWQSGALRFGLTDRHGAAPCGAAPRDDNLS
mgnify:CR=1 FL=1